MVMHDFWQQYKYQIIGTSLGIAFHSVILAVVMNGKGTIFTLLALFDFPIFLLIYGLEYFSSIRFGETIFESMFSVDGTLMYAILGWKAQSFFARHPELFPYEVEKPHGKPIQHDNQDEKNQ